MNFTFTPRPSPDFELSAIKAIELEAAAHAGAISLAQGIPSFNTPRSITEFVEEKIRQGACDRYSLTTGLAELREEISLSLLADKMRYDPDREIIITAGSIEALTASLLGLTEPGDEVIVPSPSYVSYAACIKLAGCLPRFVALDEDAHFDLHIENIEAALNRKTRVIFYCNPNNPTGTIYSEEKTRKLGEIAARNGIFLLTDEVYKDFYYVKNRHFSPALIPDLRENVVRVFSFSKAYAMTGWRVGYLHADHALVKRILPYHDAMVTCAPVASQYAALAALRHGQAEIDYFRAEYLKRRNIILEALDQLSHRLDYQMPQAAYFVFPRIKDSVPLAHHSSQLAYDILEKAGLALVPGVAFGPTGESHLRISFGREESDVRQGMQRLLEYFSNVGRTRSRPVNTDQPAAHSGRAMRQSFIESILAIAARHYLHRTKPKIIGICGTRGKTVCKRTVGSFLQRLEKVRFGMLSYNTSIGLPLAVLNLEVPRKRIAKLLFPFRLIGRTFLAHDPSKILILEYGVRSLADARQLCDIVVPDWLIVSDLSGQDISLDYRAIQEGVSYLIEKIAERRVIWYCDDPLISELSPKLSPEMAIKDEQFKDGQLFCGNTCFSVKRDLPGRAYRLAILAAARLGNELGFQAAEIERSLNSD